MLTVEIIEKETGKVFYTEEPHGLIGTVERSYRPNLKSQAWDAAVADGFVQKEDRDKYEIRVYEKEE